MVTFDWFEQGCLRCSMKCTLHIAVTENAHRPQTELENEKIFQTQNQSLHNIDENSVFS